VKASNNQYLKWDGSLVPSPSQETLYTLEIRSGQYSGMALKDYRGKYLTTVGKDAVMQSRNNSFTKDELFTLEDSHPQVFITAHNGKKVSIKQGIDLTANQDELSDRETFQCEYDKQSNQWRFRTTDNKYWSLESASGIQGVGNAQSATTLFTIDWLPDGHVTLCASNNRYVTARMNGSLYAVSDAPTEKEQFYLTVNNRPILVLKCDYGFIGFKLPSNPRIECNKASYDVITLEHTNGTSGNYFFKGHNGLYWNLDDQDMINADCKEGQPFIIELRGLSKFAVKAPNGNYLKGEQNGIVSAKSSDPLKATLWEF
jgi:fascin 1/2